MGNWTLKSLGEWLTGSRPQRPIPIEFKQRVITLYAAIDATRFTRDAVISELTPAFWVQLVRVFLDPILDILTAAWSILKALIGVILIPLKLIREVAKLVQLIALLLKGIKLAKKVRGIETRNTLNDLLYDRFTDLELLLVEAALKPRKREHNLRLVDSRNP